MAKLLIVDDSALMRKCLREIFEAGGKFEIITARNGQDALAQIVKSLPSATLVSLAIPTPSRGEGRSLLATKDGDENAPPLSRRR